MSLKKQLYYFILIGGLCFFLDYSLMIILTEFFNVFYLFSCICAFLVAVTINYILSMRYVFESRPHTSKNREFFEFIFVSIGGLILTEVLMYFLTELTCLHYTLSKILVSGLVMAYNFILKKLLLDNTKLDLKE